MWPIIKKAVNSDLSTPLNTLINNVKSIVNTINTNVGLNADAASATGSLHAKIKEIRSYLGGEIQHPRSFKKIDWYVNNTELTNVLYVTGKGELLTLMHINPTNSPGIKDYIELF